MALANVLLSVACYPHELDDLRNDQQYGGDMDAEIIIKTHRGQGVPLAEGWTEQKIEAVMQSGWMAGKKHARLDLPGSEAGHA